MDKIIIVLSLLLIVLFLQSRLLYRVTHKKISTRYNLPTTKFTNLLRDISFNTPCDIAKVKSKPADARTIFVSVASYRDDECPNTLKSIYDNAKFPDRIYVGICQQNHKSDIDCVTNRDPGSFQKGPGPFKNVSIIRLEDFEAKGPTYARYMCSKLYNNEDYFLQIDSHIHFVKDWDEKIINMIDNIPFDKAVITNHPKDWTQEDKTDDSTVSTFCTGHINSSGMIAYVASLVANKGECMEVPYTAAGFMFTYGCVLNEVPFDPNLNQLFEGEEGLFSLRLWTSGWNMYAPNKDICFHYYTRADKPKYWSNPDYGKYVDQSKHKVRVLMGFDDIKDEDNFSSDFKLYGLGSERTLEQYYKFIGYDPVTKHFSKNFC